MEKKVLYINACARSESRTDRIARALLERLGGLQSTENRHTNTGDHYEKTEKALYGRHPAEDLQNAADHDRSDYRGLYCGVFFGYDIAANVFCQATGFSTVEIAKAHRGGASDKTNMYTLITQCFKTFSKIEGGGKTF